MGLKRKSLLNNSLGPWCSLTLMVSISHSAIKVLNTKHKYMINFRVKKVCFFPPPIVEAMS